MRKLFPLNCGKTLITHLMNGTTPSEIISQCRNGAVDGADAIALELHRLPPEFRTKDVFKSIIDCVPIPFMFILYRRNIFNDDSDDEKRIAVLMDAVDAGAGMIDIVGDTYAPSPDECTYNPEAIEKQTQLIKEIHNRGAQVIMSSHPCRYMSSDEVFRQLSSFAQRGADVVKLVAIANTDAEFHESVGTFMRLNHDLNKPYVYLCGGEFATIQRFLGLQLGCAITFGIHEYPSNGDYGIQPTIRQFKNVQSSILWHI